MADTASLIASKAFFFFDKSTRKHTCTCTNTHERTPLFTFVGKRRLFIGCFGAGMKVCFLALLSCYQDGILTNQQQVLRQCMKCQKEVVGGRGHFVEGA